MGDLKQDAYSFINRQFISALSSLGIDLSIAEQLNNELRMEVKERILKTKGLFKTELEKLAPLWRLSIDDLLAFIENFLQKNNPLGPQNRSVRAYTNFPDEPPEKNDMEEDNYVPSELFASKMINEYEPSSYDDELRLTMPNDELYRKYESDNVINLRKIARQENVPNYQKMKKAELVNQIVMAQTNPTLYEPIRPRGRPSMMSVRANTTQPSARQPDNYEEKLLKVYNDPGFSVDDFVTPPKNIPKPISKRRKIKLPKLSLTQPLTPLTKQARWDFREEKNLFPPFTKQEIFLGNRGQEEEDLYSTMKPAKRKSGKSKIADDLSLFPSPPSSSAFEITPGEMSYDEFVHGSGVKSKKASVKQASVKQASVKQANLLQSQLYILQGEIMAGNDNVHVLNNLKNVLMKMNKMKIITKSQMNNEFNKLKNYNK